MPRLKITKENMEIIKPVSGQVDYLDTDLSGFGVRATKGVLTSSYTNGSGSNRIKPSSIGTMEPLLRPRPATQQRIICDVWTSERTRIQRYNLNVKQ